MIIQSISIGVLRRETPVLFKSKGRIHKKKNGNSRNFTGNCNGFEEGLESLVYK